ncbi:hypothetical protein FNF27_02854 [Cafeteria roenbergensis]|nr:hypothetical protein FNF31_03966 [Cafeteria roenbergensis]KAA0175768.1 hypothetical protein FNF27_02854 [Cafeteria roenbergensis]
MLGRARLARAPCSSSPRPAVEPRRGAGSLALYDATAAPSVDLPLMASKWLRVQEDFITREEEKALALYFHERLCGQQYSEGHWDSVIVSYRETLMAWEELPAALRPAVERLASLFEPGAQVQRKVHAIDLSESHGRIDGHVDSVKFCGEHVIGLCLLSPAVMRFKRAAPDEVHAGTEERAGYVKVKPQAGDAAGAAAASATDAPGDMAPGAATTEWVAAPGTGAPGETVDVLLRRRSAYVMYGVGRFGYEHAVLGGVQRFGPEEVKVRRRRRISLIVRDEADSALAPVV